jgi:hypothetical protein
MSQEFIVRLRGSSYSNTDGTDRQQLVARCRTGEQLMLLAEPDNPHDRHAVAVLNLQGLQLGYLPSDARDASAILRGEGITAFVLKPIGGPRWWHRLFGVKRSYGLLIKLCKAPIDWRAHNQHREEAQAIDALVNDALAFEGSGASHAEVIARYQSAMAGVVHLNTSNPVAAAHRYQQAPINRLTMLLVKEKRSSDARAAYCAWRAVPDPIGLRKSDHDAVEKRMAKLSRRGGVPN